MSNTHPVQPQTRDRWRKLAAELTDAADDADAGADVRERVGRVLVRECLALGAASPWPRPKG